VPCQSLAGDQRALRSDGDFWGAIGVTTRRKSLLARWAERPFEQKIAVVAGVLVPLVVGVAVPLMLARDGKPWSSPTRLEVVSLVVRDGSVAGKPSEAAGIEVTVRNIGSLVSVIKRVELRVRDFLLIKPCGVHGAPLRISARYQAQLPAYDAAGRTVVVDVSQQLRPNEADRFAVSLGPPRGRTIGSLEQRVYALDVTLYHDAERRPLKAGAAVLAMPLPSYEASFHPRAKDEEACVASNLSGLRRLLDLDGERSSDLVRLKGALDEVETTAEGG
jgi:hypothetical protein